MDVTNVRNETFTMSAGETLMVNADGAVLRTTPENVVVPKAETPAAEEPETGNKVPYFIIAALVVAIGSVIRAVRKN